MPISPEKRALYPANWKSEIRPRILDRDGHRCKQCGVENYAEGWRDPDGTFHEVECMHDRAVHRIVRIVLTIAHVHDPNPANCADDNLAALCQRCHNILDMPMRQANAALTRRRKAGTPDLFDRSAA